MINNDILIRLRYALDIRDTEMVEIFKIGGLEVTKEEVQEMLKKDTIDNETNHSNDIEVMRENEIDYVTLESFLNGFIIYKRGKQSPKPGQPEQPEFSIKDHRNVNNVMLKKLKIALQLTSEDILEIMEKAGVEITKGELGAVLRKEGHRNYKECGDRYARNFLKGLTIKHRG